MAKYTIQCNVTLTLDDKIYPGKLPADLSKLEQVLLDNDDLILIKHAEEDNAQYIGSIRINYFAVNYPFGLIPQEEV